MTDTLDSPATTSRDIDEPVTRPSKLALQSFEGSPSQRSRSSTPRGLPMGGADTPPASASDPVDNSNAVTSAVASEDISANASSSENASVKGDDKNAFQPYGTRSRHRPGPRPNYSEDNDNVFDAPPSKVEVTTSKRSTPSEPSSTKPRPTTDAAEVTSQPDRPRSGFTAVNSSKSNSTQTNGTTAKPAQSASAGNPTDPTQPRQKRKYVWKNGSRPASSGRHASKDSQAAAVVNSSANAPDTPEQPPAKKRRTGDGLTTGFGAGSMPTPISKRTSVSTSGKVAGNESCVVTFEKTKNMLKDGKLHADDGTVFAVDDHAYLICEPPGDPYYICRIMEFRRDDMNDPKSPVTSMIVNWFYRPKDIGRFSADPRYLFASMQSDESPINSLRGKCTIKHRTQIKDLEEFRKQRDTFWFNQLYDRYIHRPYDLVPAAAVINVPKRVKKAIDERWKFLVVESARLKELTSAVKTCKRCSDYCAPNDSVDCGVCRNTYHMACVRPPLQKKPSRGFAWSCGPCSRAREKKLEARHSSIIPDKGSEAEDEPLEDEDEVMGTADEEPKSTTVDNPADHENHTQAEVAKAQMWPWRYLGIHCNVEDVLQYDDRAIYPRASSRLGTRHQATVSPWYGRPVELVPMSDVRKKYGKGTGKKDTKPPKDASAALDREKIERANRPKWMQDEPFGYVARGEDYDSSDPRCTAERLFVLPEEDEEDQASTATSDADTAAQRTCDDFMDRFLSLCQQQGFARPCVASNKAVTTSETHWVLPTNYIDKALNVLYKNELNVNLAIKELQAVRGPKDFKDPVLTKEELKRFEDGVTKFGSELRLVRKHVKTKPQADIVRFYYNWKKTGRGVDIWGRHDARRGSRKRSEISWTEIADDDDDSAFDNARSIAKKRRFECKFCLTQHSRQWRRAPQVAPGAVSLADPKGSTKDKSNQLVVALCQRCAHPWRRYAIRWEDVEEFAKALTSVGARHWKRAQDEHMLRELVLANEITGIPTTGAAATAAASIGITLTVPVPDPANVKKKTASEKEQMPTPPPEPKKKAQVVPPPPPPPRLPTPPPVPAQPRMRVFPCVICAEDETKGSLISCTSCRLTVHHRCYAVPEQASPVKWQCDTCVNDRNGLFSLTYNCILCTVAERQPEMVELPKQTHRKKNDRDREKERMEKQLTDEMASKYKREQLAKGRPVFPREALKRTSSNNWVHVLCAVWTPEIKFDNPRNFEGAEGMGAAMVNPQRMDSVCVLCKTVGGACVQCHYDKCNATFHVGCAQVAGYRFGFDIKPVKSTQKNSVTTVALGLESGLMTAVIYCAEHDVASTPILHGFHEQTESGLNALEAFVCSYKQADKSLTGTARKANMLSQSTKAIASASQGNFTSGPGRRASLLNNPAISKGRRFSTNAGEDIVNHLHGVDGAEEPENRECSICKTDTTFRWWTRNNLHSRSHSMATHMPNGVNGINHEPYWLCHKCHIKLEQGVEPTPPPSVDEDDLIPFTQKDYFELTMAPPAPSQPPQGMFLPPHQANPMQHLVHQPPPPPGQHWHGDNSPHSATSPNPELAKWTHDLWSSTVTLVRPDNLRIRYSGREFGSVEDDATKSWDTFLRRAERELGFDGQRHTFFTNDRTVVSDCGGFIAALAVIIKNGAGHAIWTIEEAPWLAAQQQQPHHLLHHHHHHPQPPPPQPHHHTYSHPHPPPHHQAPYDQRHQPPPPPPGHQYPGGPHPLPPQQYPYPQAPPPNGYHPGPHHLPGPVQPQQQQPLPPPPHRPVSRPSPTIAHPIYGPPTQQQQHSPQGHPAPIHAQSLPPTPQHQSPSTQQLPIMRPPSPSLINRPSALSTPPPTTLTKGYPYPPSFEPPQHRASPKLGFDTINGTSQRDAKGVVYTSPSTSSLARTSSVIDPPTRPGGISTHVQYSPRSITGPLSPREKVSDDSTIKASFPEQRQPQPAESNASGRIEQRARSRSPPISASAGTVNYQQDFRNQGQNRDQVVEMNGNGARQGESSRGGPSTSVAAGGVGSGSAGASAGTASGSGPATGPATGSATGASTSPDLRHLMH